MVEACLHEGHQLNIEGVGARVSANAINQDQVALAFGCIEKPACDVSTGRIVPVQAMPDTCRCILASKGRGRPSQLLLLCFLRGRT